MQGPGEPIREITSDYPIDVIVSGDTVHISFAEARAQLVRLTQEVNPFEDAAGITRRAFRWRHLRPGPGGTAVNHPDLVEGLRSGGSPSTWPAFCLYVDAVVNANPLTGDIVLLYPGYRDGRPGPSGGSGPGSGSGTANYGLEWFFFPPARPGSGTRVEITGPIGINVTPPAGMVNHEVLYLNIPQSFALGHPVFDHGEIIFFVDANSNL